jgi:hypothetical protein
MTGMDSVNHQKGPGASAGQEFIDLRTAAEPLTFTIVHNSRAAEQLASNAALKGQLFNQQL